MIINFSIKNKIYSTDNFQGLLLLLMIVFYSCTSDSSYNEAELKTDGVTLITETTALSGGSIISDGGAEITLCGVCWSIDPSPTNSLATKTTVGGGTGSFTCNIKGLKAGTLYYVRAFATTRIGTFYGDQVSFTTTSKEIKTVSDIDGNIYHIVTIGTQEWMVENLKTTRYRNGDTIGTTIPSTKRISEESEPKYQWAFNGDENFVSKYGRLYTMYTVSDSRKLAPTGWHIPTDAEWTTLENYLIVNGYNYDGKTTGNKIAKSMASTTDWAPYIDMGVSIWNTGAIGTDLTKNNSSGFSALPGGGRFGDGSFGDLNYFGYWWASSQNNPSNVWIWFLCSTLNDLNRTYSSKSTGYSVRCVKDNE